MPSKGIKAEKSVADSLRRAGASVKRSPGSRTSADLAANWDYGKKWLVQVKSSLRGVPAGLKSSERRAILARADRNNATAVLAKRIPGRIDFEAVRSGRKLKP